MIHLVITGGAKRRPAIVAYW